ncbi:monovalent cation/H+ antiporter complex subunit F [Iamia sp.]|uniref:monovalent cation/H+ antiporter complex subunit F n=1 Tax=Iamia sp. TaxID=2722710 RepID=UPI002CBB989C|nr:monovalent cation/H+ antiporter complex subunit F [Iamia sp.]HXH57715.1 monovalent cation/H+ antiporter complex subunit F [Iamia sp.]
MIPVIYAVLGLAFALFAFRLGRGPTLADRVLAVDGMLVCAISSILVNAMDTGRGAFLQVAVMLTLVGFISTAVIARFIEGRGA